MVADVVQVALSCVSYIVKLLAVSALVALSQKRTESALAKAGVMMVALVTPNLYELGPLVPQYAAEV